MKSKAYRAAIRQRQAIHSTGAARDLQGSIQLNWDGTSEQSWSGRVEGPAFSTVVAQTPMTACTIATWFRWASTTVEPAVNDFFMGATDDGATAATGPFLMHTGLQVVAFYPDGLEDGPEYDAGGSFFENWHHYVCVYDGGEAASDNRAKLYIDGASVGTVNGTPATSYTATADPFTVGAPGGYEGSLSPHALFAHTGVYDVALTAAQVTEIYNGGSLYDLRRTAPDDLQLYWPYDAATNGDDDTEGTGNIVDVSGKGNHGTPLGTNAGAVQLKTNDYPS